MSLPANSPPLISVVIPAYNAEQFIADALLSIKEQDYAPIEILVVDDGSCDNTADIVRQTAPKARLIQQKNAGASAARNTGMRHATGEYICFLDADDGWFPGKLRAQVDYLAEHLEVGVVYHEWLVWKPDTDGTFHSPAIPIVPPSGSIQAEHSGWLYCLLLLDSIVHTSTVMLRRQVLNEIGYFDTALEIGEDYDYWIRVSRHYPIHKLSGTYSFYRATPGSLTTHPKPKNYEYSVINSAISRWGLIGPDHSPQSQKKIQHRLHRAAYDFASNHFHYGSPSIARHWFLQSLRHRVTLKGLLYAIAATAKSTFTRGS